MHARLAWREIALRGHWRGGDASEGNAADANADADAADDADDDAADDAAADGDRDAPSAWRARCGHVVGIVHTNYRKVRAGLLSLSLSLGDEA